MALSAADFEYVRTLLHQRAAIVLETDKRYLAETRLLPLARREGFASLDDLVSQLRLGPCNGLHQKVVEAMTTNETSFFRDIHPFECLRQTLLPELLRRRAAERRLRIWCGACSSGQEPYSVVMLLREHFAADLDGWSLRLVASDLSTDMLERARQGRYNHLEVSRGLPARLLVKYFQRQGLDWQIRDDLRRMVEFCPINLIDAWPPLPPVDLILLRNVLIYFDVPTKKRVLTNIRRVLHPDGYLLLGGAETTLNLDDAFERDKRFDRTSCYRLRKS